jgi:hypothetical protein
MIFEEILGVMFVLIVILIVKLFTHNMKEELNANILTKYLVGQCSLEEELFIQQWLKDSSYNQYFFAFLKQNIQQNKQLKVRTLVG